MATKTQFINVSISGMQRVRYADILPHPDDYLLYVEELVLAGFKVSLRFDVDSNSASAYITDLQSDSDNLRPTLSTWGKSLQQCVCDLALVIAYANLNELDWVSTWDKLKDESAMDVQELQEFAAWKRSQTNAKDS